MLINLNLGVDVFSQLLFVWERRGHAVSQQVAFPRAMPCVPSTEPRTHRGRMAVGRAWVCGGAQATRESEMSGCMGSLVFTKEHFGTTENSKVSVLSAGA